METFKSEAAASVSWDKTSATCVSATYAFLCLGFSFEIVLLISEPRTESLALLQINLTVCVLSSI